MHWVDWIKDFAFNLKIRCLSFLSLFFSLSHNLWFLIFRPLLGAGKDLSLLPTTLAFESLCSSASLLCPHVNAKQEGLWCQPIILRPLQAHRFEVRWMGNH